MVKVDKARIVAQLVIDRWHATGPRTYGRLDLLCEQYAAEYDITDRLAVILSHAEIGVGIFPLGWRGW